VSKKVLISLFILLCHIPLVHAEDFMNEVARANDLYASNNYQKAADAYESLKKKGLNNGHLYFNLGNTYIRLGKTGPAILNYIRAQKLIPRDENLQANLNFAIQQTRDKITPPPPDTLATLFFWINDLSLNENINFTIAINLTFWLTLIAWFYFRTDFLRLARNSIFFLLMLAFVAIGVKLNLESNSKTGVILAKTVSVKSGLDTSNITLFELHEGALVNITDERQGWIEVQLDSKQKGWIPKDSIGV
jgi:tetratricopeptide (TPR) repeat protein